MFRFIIGAGLSSPPGLRVAVVLILTKVSFSQQWCKFAGKKLFSQMGTQSVPENHQASALTIVQKGVFSTEVAMF
ncbi:hypothetical protein BR93DRAFT_931866 [Coniochaeta sp. PMI_546]|nr:hypothetical protein BR93DRAFT_931866 [Coniochaeta sp. PMI_546]